jgi:hypothetical protein
MNLLNVYAQKTIVGGVKIFRDKDRKEEFCHINALASDIPDRRNKYIILNCYKWRIVWLDGVYTARDKFELSEA